MSFRCIESMHTKTVKNVSQARRILEEPTAKTEHTQLKLT